jgi:hypothetical protein
MKSENRSNSMVQPPVLFLFYPILVGASHEKGIHGMFLASVYSTMAAIATQGNHRGRRGSGLLPASLQAMNPMPPMSSGKAATAREFMRNAANRWPFNSSCSARAVPQPAQYNPVS